MRKILVVLGAVVALAMPAQASASVIIGGQTNCNENAWQTIGTGPYHLTGNYASFGWTQLPNKSVTIRSIATNGAEYGRYRWDYPVGFDIHTITPWLLTGTGFYVQCRLPTGWGSFANPKTGELFY